MINPEHDPVSGLQQAISESEAFIREIVDYDHKHAIESDGYVVVNENGLYLHMVDFSGNNESWAITPGEARVLAARLLRGAAEYEFQELKAGWPVDIDRVEERQVAEYERTRAGEFARSPTVKVI